MAQVGPKVLTNAGDALTVALAMDKSTAISYQTSSAAPANAVVVLEGTVNNVDWFTLASLDPTSGTAASQVSSTGANKAGICPINAGSLTAVRLRRTDANGSACSVTIGLSTA